MGNALWYYIIRTKIVIINNRIRILVIVCRYMRYTHNIYIISTVVMILLKLHLNYFMPGQNGQQPLQPKSNQN